MEGLEPSSRVSKTLFLAIELHAREKINKYMIYTVGRKDIYEPYLANDPNPRKGKTGSVWQTKEEAAVYAKDGFQVYGVMADWNLDTAPDGDEHWHQLLTPAKLVRV